MGVREGVEDLKFLCADLKFSLPPPENCSKITLIYLQNILAKILLNFKKCVIMVVKRGFLKMGFYDYFFINLVCALVF